MPHASRWAVGWLLICVSPLAAQWTTVGTGIESRQFTAPGPNDCFVTRMQRNNPGCGIDSTIGSGALYSGRETVSGQAARYDEAIGYWGDTWGSRQDVVVAINGDFFDLSSGMPTGGQIQGGWYCKRFPEFGGWAGMAAKIDGDYFMGACVNNPAAKQIVRYLGTGTTANFNGINTTRASGDLIIYTHHYDSNTHTDNSGAEVLVEMSAPLQIIPSPNKVLGTVREVRSGAGASPIPFDHIVLSAGSSRAAGLLANATVGSQIGVSMEIGDYLPGCSTRSGFDWTRAYACAGGNFIYLRDGVPQPTTNAGLIVRHPRTAVAFNDTHVFFIVVDGRSARSVGVDMTEMAAFTSTLGATWGYNMDGGGSSAMWVNGQIKNVPSDGSERTVANGMVMVNILPRELSSHFAAGNQVRTGTATALRLGPGTNFDSIGSVAASAKGAVLEHALSGVAAKGQHWFKCSFGGATGWVTESALVRWTADFDGDQDVDQDDFAHLQECLTGSVNPQNDPLCQDTKLDGDTDVDQEDVDAFITCMSGPGQPPPANCLP